MSNFDNESQRNAARHVYQLLESAWLIANAAGLDAMAADLVNTRDGIARAMKEDRKSYLERKTTTI